VNEWAERRERRRLIDASVPLMKRLEDFRFDDKPTVAQATVAPLADGSWLDDRETVSSPPSRAPAKHISRTALAISVSQQGRRVRFATLAGANELQEAESRSKLKRVAARYARIELLSLDELGSGRQ
jgi:DNA replication protein DnaC